MIDEQNNLSEQEKRKLYRKEYYKNNKHRINKEVLKECQKRYYQKNKHKIDKEKNRDNVRRFRLKHKNIINQQKEIEDEIIKSKENIINDNIELPLEYLIKKERNRRYYEKNRDAIKKKNLERYYSKKNNDCDKINNDNQINNNNQIINDNIKKIDKKFVLKFEVPVELK